MNEWTIAGLIRELNIKFANVASNREVSLARTKLDECELWAGKAGLLDEDGK